jgi:hypothetical protein
MGIAERGFTAPTSLWSCICPLICNGQNVRHADRRLGLDPYRPQSSGIPADWGYRPSSPPSRWTGGAPRFAAIFRPAMCRR